MPSSDRKVEFAGIGAPTATPTKDDDDGEVYVEFETPGRVTAAKYMEERDGESKSGAGLGTISGVFLPCMQNILGVILFLRLPWITAQAGTWLSCLIVACCVGSTLPTALSISAIATNGRIPGGGPYYVVSRNLGPEFGGAIGICFYLGTTIAATMYVLGAVEAFQTGFGFTDLFSWDTEIIALIVMFSMACVVSVGVKFVSAVSPVFLAVVIMSVCSALVGVCLFAAGVSFGGTDELKTGPASLGPSYEKDADTGITPSFTTLLALFYPSVTGIMAGSNRSGVLADPGRSIPVGTLGAIFVTTVLYLAVIWSFGVSVANETLKANKLVVATVAWPVPVIVNLGIIMSSVGAGLQSLTGAPQLLASIVDDDILPFLNFLKAKAEVDATGTATTVPSGGVASPTPSPIATPRTPRTPTPGGKPRTFLKEIWVTWFIASVPCLAGNLDFITPPQTIFFLAMYMSINLSVLILSLLRSPGFRPRWKYYHWSTALFGVIICCALMLVVSWVATLGAGLIVAFLYRYIQVQRNRMQWGDWGDSVTGLRMEQARTALLALQTRIPHPKNWRPQILVLARANRRGLPDHRRLLVFASQLKKGRGLTVVGSVYQGSMLDDELLDTVEGAKGLLQHHVNEAHLYGFANVMVSDTVVNGIMSMVQNAGLGALQPNTVMLCWPSSWESNDSKMQAFVLMLKALRRLKKALVCVRGIDEFPENAERVTGTIDIWWIVHDGGLLFLLPYLLTRSRVWRGCRLRLFSVMAAGKALAGAKARLLEHLARLRIQAEVMIVTTDEDVISDSMQDRTLDLKARYNLLKQLKANTMTVVESKARETSLQQQGLALPTVRDPSTGARAPSTGRQGQARASLAMIFAGVEGAEEATTVDGAGAGAGDAKAAEADGDGTPAADGADGVAGAVGATSPKSGDGDGGDSADSGAEGEDGDGVAGLPGERVRSMSLLSMVSEEDRDDIAATLDKRALVGASAKRLKVAHKLNAAMKRYSSEAQLIVTNMPLTRNIGAREFMEYVEAVIEGLPRVMMVRGSGAEVVTEYA